MSESEPSATPSASLLILMTSASLRAVKMTARGRVKTPANVTTVVATTCGGEGETTRTTGESVAQTTTAAIAMMNETATTTVLAITGGSKTAAEKVSIASVDAREAWTKTEGLLVAAARAFPTSNVLFVALDVATLSTLSSYLASVLSCLLLTSTPSPPDTFV